MVGDPLGAEDVLDRDRDPGQLALAAAPSPFSAVRQVGVQLVARGGLAVGVEVLLGGEVAGADPLGRLRRP